MKREPFQQFRVPGREQSENVCVALIGDRKLKTSFETVYRQGGHRWIYCDDDKVSGHDLAGGSK